MNKKNYTAEEEAALEEARRKAKEILGEEKKVRGSGDTGDGDTGGNGGKGGGRKKIVPIIIGLLVVAVGFYAYKKLKK
jgi:hypothetical protein